VAVGVAVGVGLAVEVGVGVGVGVIAQARNKINTLLESWSATARSCVKSVGLYAESLEHRRNRPRFGGLDRRIVEALVTALVLAPP
jgi:hypothetical protein